MVTSFGRMMALVLITASSFALADASPVSAAEATTLANTYGQALRSGDLEALRGITGGALQRKRASLWNTSGYEQLLIDHYGTTSFSVQQVTLNQNGSSVAIVAFQSDSETITKRLTIARIGEISRIVDERMAD